MKITARIRRISESLSVVLRSLTPQRAGAAVAALLFTLGTAGIPASRPLMPEDHGERFGVIHWYEAEKAPAEAGAFRKSADFRFIPQ